MKVAFITDTLQMGGKERRLVEIITGLLVRNKISPILILWDGISEEESIAYKSVLKSNIPIYYLGKTNLSYKIHKVYEILKAENIKAINTWAPPIYSYYLLFPQILLRIPTYNSSITGARDGYSKKEILVMHSLHYISKLVNSNCMRAMNLFHIPLKKRKVIYNGFNMERVENLESSDTIRSKFSIETKYIVSMAGRYNNAKDWITHVKASNLILDLGYDVTFLCMGSGDPTEYENFIKPNHRNKIRFIGPQTDVESIFAASDIVTLSTFGEGISNSILEGMAVSKPIVATEGGGTPEIVEHGVSGFITKMEDIKDYSNRIIELLDNEQLRKLMGSRGFAIVNEKFNMEQMLSGFESMFLNGQ